MRIHLQKILTGALFALLFSNIAIQAQKVDRQLVFSDEFNGAAGSRANPEKWTQEKGGGGWGNQELQFYTDTAENAYADGSGSLVIKTKAADRPPPDCWYGQCQYTSARLITKKKFELKYGRFEARIKIPRGQGIWPAFWMLGNDIDTAGWPDCGEIDIMENIGREPNVVHGTIHGPGYSGEHSIGSSYQLPGNAAFADDFHVFAVDWSKNRIRWYVDGKLRRTFTPDDLPAGKKWVYDHPFFILLNLAVGGPWGGRPDETTRFPQEMLVDYVRVYGK